ncbi:MAG: sugar phosphate isomerase/epimerase, partial [Acidobacteria bacterium]|nr:sugar phosphate isomerase/epimerase [Acidobacteriota bacterium]
MSRQLLSRRSFIAAAAATPLAFGARKVPIGLELYSVRTEMQKDLMGTVRAVAKMGYQGVEFYAPYYEWTPDYARQVRKLLDELKIRCYSTHNGPKSFSPEGIGKAVELNSILGSKYVVMASAGKVVGLDGWRRVADTLSRSVAKMKPAGIQPGYHNHQAEFRAIDGKMPIEVIAAACPQDAML